MQPGQLEIDRPLGAAEVVAEAFREYGRRPRTYVAIGALEAVATLATYDAGDARLALGLAVVAATFVACFVATVCVASGWSLKESRRRVRNAAVALGGLMVVVGLPQTLGRVNALLLLVAILWLALTAFAVPIVLREQHPERPVAFQGMLASLRRSTALSQVAFWHTIVVIFILYVVVLLITSVLAAALSNYGDQSQLAALVITRAVLIPVVLIGLVVLYLDQRERSLELTDVPVGDNA